MTDYLKVKGKYFCKGQKVRVLEPGSYFWKRGRIECEQDLKSFYERTGLIPVEFLRENTESFNPKQLQILNAKKKGGVRNMPRIVKFALYATLVLFLWDIRGPLAQIVIKYLSSFVH